MSSAANAIGELDEVPTRDSERVQFFAKCNAIVKASILASNAFDEFPEAQTSEFRALVRPGLFELRMLEAAFAAEGLELETEIEKVPQDHNALSIVFRSFAQSAVELSNYIDAVVDPNLKAAVASDIAACTAAGSQ